MLIVFPIVCLIVVYTLLRKYVISKMKITDMDKKSVLITGCDSGFGYHTALRLDKLGMTVYAACLTEQGENNLKKKASARLVTFLMDVTDEKSVAEGYMQVKEHIGNNGLWAVINNAGVLRGGLIEAMPISDWRLQLNVNVMGVAITTKQFLPLIRKAKGRIVNISSVAGRFATGGMSSYNASKFAVEGLSDAWRRELKRWGIKVVLVEPGIMKTPLWSAPLSNDYFDKIWNELGEEEKALYGRNYFEKEFEAGKQLVDKIGGDPVQVVDALESSVTEIFPPTRYVVGSDTWVWLTMIHLPSFASDFLLHHLVPKPKPVALA